MQPDFDCIKWMTDKGHNYTTCSGAIASLLLETAHLSAAETEGLKGSRLLHHKQDIPIPSKAEEGRPVPHVPAMVSLTNFMKPPDDCSGLCAVTRGYKEDEWVIFDS